MSIGWHVFERFVTHLVMGTGIVLMAFFILDYLRRHSARAATIIPGKKRQLTVFAAILSALLIFMREPFDWASGGPENPWWKSLFDYLSWWLGNGCGCWGLFRYDARKEPP